MKILQITYSLSSGGGERFVVDLSNELIKNNEVILLQIQTNSNPDNAHYLPDVDKRIKYINLDSVKGLSLQVMKGIRRVIKQENPDVVHIHCGLLTTALAAMTCRKPRYFHTLHSLAQRCLGGNRNKPLFRFLYKHRVQPITISNACLESYEELYHLGNGVRINNGRSPILTSEKAAEVKAEIDSLKLHEDDKVFIHVARFHPVKNQELLFRTFMRLSDEGEHVQLIVIGNGYDNTPLIKYNEVKGINLLGEKRNVGDYLASSDYFIMSSLMEGLPISLLEAMSMGLIPVSTPAGGVCDVVRNGENGYLSGSHDADAYYKTVRDAIHNTANVQPSAIIEEYKQKYSMTACAKNYMDVFCRE